jgi:hypothetical protein
MCPVRALFACCLLLASCGSAQEQPASTPTLAAAPAPDDDPIPLPKFAAEEKKPEKPETHPIPTACAPSDNAKLCLPDQAFVEKLCQGVWPDIALTLFRKNSPWTRGYSTRVVQAWNASGGAMSTSAKLAAHEELILLKERANAGGIVVGGASSGFDALRWDGTCVSLSGDEVTMRRPGEPKFAPIPWRKLAEKTQTALLSDPRIKQSFDKRRKECQGDGVAIAGATPCDRAEASLSWGIVWFIRGGGAIPEPAELP